MIVKSTAIVAPVVRQFDRHNTPRKTGAAFSEQVSDLQLELSHPSALINTRRGPRMGAWSPTTIGATMTTSSIGGYMPTDNTLERLRSQALQLSEQERSELAHSLIQSLYAPADDGVEAAWDIEIARRIAEIDSGQAKLLSREEFRQKIQARLGTR